MIHTEYAQGESGNRPGKIADELTKRQAALEKRIATAETEPGPGADEQAWKLRSYPVLAILAPVMSTSEEKIEFPGDPMCLYAALSYAVEQAAQAREKGTGADSPYNDLCPRWGNLPSTGYRLRVDDNGIRQYDGESLNTDQTVFDPRVWNEKVKQYFIEHVLKNVQPKVALISAVSPAHRYAIDMARTVREHLPDCILVLGGRHADETLHYDFAAGQLKLEPSCTICRLPPGERVFDFIVSGEAYYALDALMKAISLAMDIETQTPDVARIISVLSKFAPLLGPIPGRALITAVTQAAIHAWPVAGEMIRLHELPSPYRAFAIRARFPIFEIDGRVARTAHFMVTNACPFHCYFCSEGVTVVGEFLTFKAAVIEKAIERVVEYIEYGAEALFFDDSIFWGGNVGHIINFCKEWIKIRRLAESATEPVIRVFGREIERQKVINLAWGAQFTVDFLASRRNPQEAMLVLNTMRAAGCTYIYMGIESMSASVIERVHKNINKSQPWDERVRMALGMSRYAGIRVGSSVLFGLDGETDETIEETISKVEELVAEDMLYVASPNILTYHPNTEITHLHEMDDKLDYHSPNLDNRPPYTYFEEAFPAVVSKNLSEAQIWNIHEQTKARWGKKRNLNPMPEVELREE
jgi:radical SAM superfamily enzyme YgiQ (UPF0313 family)